MRGIYLIAAILLTFGMALSGSAQVPKEPDLDVLFIEQWPIYQGYWHQYPGNLPALVKPGTGGPGKPAEYCYTRDEYESLRKTHPDEGEEITFTAFVANKGGVRVGPSEYVFRVDKRQRMKGELPPLEPGEKTTVAMKWPYKSGRHFVSFEIDPKDKIKEICEVNNEREDPTFGFILTITAGNKGEYPAFNATENLIGSYSFEDWCQHHIDVWNESLAKAVYTSTPNGVSERIRFDGAFSSDDPELPERVHWRLSYRMDMIPKMAKTVDSGLIHELLHQCGISDLYATTFVIRESL